MKQVPDKTPTEDFIRAVRASVARLEAEDTTIDTIYALLGTDLDAIRAEERAAIERFAEAHVYAVEVAAYRRHIEKQLPKVTH